MMIEVRGERVNVHASSAMDRAPGARARPMNDNDTTIKGDEDNVVISGDRAADGCLFCAYMCICNVRCSTKRERMRGIEMAICNSYHARNARNAN